MFADDLNNAKRQYKNFVHDEDSKEVTDFFSKKNLPSMFGTEDFIQWVKATFHGNKKHDEIPQSLQLAPTISEIKKIVCDHYAVKEQTLQQSRRGQINEPRNLAIYLARKQCGLRLEEIGNEFGLTKYSSVSSIVTRTEKQILGNRQLAVLVRKIRKSLKEGQAKI
jgi:putative transposase